MWKLAAIGTFSYEKRLNCHNVALLDSGDPIAKIIGSEPCCCYALTGEPRRIPTRHQTSFVDDYDHNPTFRINKLPQAIHT